MLMGAAALVIDEITQQCHTLRRRLGGANFGARQRGGIRERDKMKKNSEGGKCLVRKIQSVIQETMETGDISCGKWEQNACRGQNSYKK